MNITKKSLKTCLSKVLTANITFKWNPNDNRWMWNCRSIYLQVWFTCDICPLSFSCNGILNQIHSNQNLFRNSRVNINLRTKWVKSILYFKRRETLQNLKKKIHYKSNNYLIHDREKSFLTKSVPQKFFQIYTLIKFMK